MPMADFLNIYKREDVYMVQRANEQMMEDIHVPVTLQCGGFQRVLQDAVVWFSSGNTRSVLHYDVLDNLLCVLEGMKEVLLINKTYSHLVEAHGFDQDGMYSRVDVDSVNMKQFPRLQKVPWYQARLQAGDCLYIPFRWYHQIKSAVGRNLALNIWFSHLWAFDQSDCDKHTQFNLTVPIKTFGVASPNEQVRSLFLEFFYGLEEVNKSSFFQMIPVEQKPLEELFAVIDKDKNSVLTWKELYLFDIDDAVRQFPNIFHSSILEKEKVRDESENIEENMDDDEADMTDEIDIPERKNDIPRSQMDNSDSKIIVDDITEHSELKSTIKVKVTPKDKVEEEKQVLEEKQDLKRKPTVTEDSKDTVLKENIKDKKHDEL
ncbi:uncharacterized protein LOC121380894 isoform X2 [Gigantopelta aegis]|nr:uncharacterized protein LOC121380894 isoform X2 [Gigantopelta aegis]